MSIAERMGRRKALQLIGCSVGSFLFPSSPSVSQESKEHRLHIPIGIIINGKIYEVRPNQPPPTNQRTEPLWPGEVFTFFDNAWALCHTLAFLTHGSEPTGQTIQSLVQDDFLSTLYKNNGKQHWKVDNIFHFKPHQSTNEQSEFILLENNSHPIKGTNISAKDLFYFIYNNPNDMVLQTCGTEREDPNAIRTFVKASLYPNEASPLKII